MSFFKNINKATLTNAHGEVNFFRVDDGEADISGFELCQPDKSGYIVGHSETGHDHVLERGDVEVRQGTVEGMQILYAILKEPLALKQKAGNPHKQQIVQPGRYIITNNIEYNPFTEQARRVTD
jgi:hypothetical protein